MNQKKLNTTNYIFLLMTPLNFDSLKSILESLKPEVEEKFKVKRIGLLDRMSEESRRIRVILIFWLIFMSR